jgi:RNA polymerase sigma factor (sigma-70 family)
MRNREDAEDALQDCLLNAFAHVKDFDERSRFATWLTRIAINAALAKLRKNRRARTGTRGAIPERLPATKKISLNETIRAVGSLLPVKRRTRLDSWRGAIDASTVLNASLN